MHLHPPTSTTWTLLCGGQQRLNPSKRIMCDNFFIVAPARQYAVALCSSIYCLMLTFGKLLVSIRLGKIYIHYSSVLVHFLGTRILVKISHHITEKADVLWFHPTCQPPRWQKWMYEFTSIFYLALFLEIFNRGKLMLFGWKIVTYEGTFCRKSVAFDDFRFIFINENEMS